MSATHTPGPWFARWSLKDGTPCGEFVTGSVAVVRAGHVNSRERPGVAQYVTNPADAALIAAAPALLAALIMVRDADNDCHKDGLQTIPPVARASIDAAIAKATGGAA